MTVSGWSLRRRGSTVVALTLGLTGLADWLFYGRPVGWTAGLFGLALFAAVWCRGGRFWRSAAGRWTAGATLGLTVALVLEPGAWAVLLGLMGLLVLAAIDRGGWTNRAALWVWRLAVFARKTLTQAWRDSGVMRRWRRTHGADEAEAWLGGVGSGGAGMWSLRAWAVPGVLSLGFVGLFSLANPVVRRGVSRVWEAVVNPLTTLGEWVEPARVLLWFVTFAAVWALLRARWRAERRRAGRFRLPSRVTNTAELVVNRVTGPGLVVRCLVLFNAVFAGQTLLDLWYLVGGAALPEGMTYAEYAQRGAYPLVATVLLAGAMVLVTFRLGGAAQRSMWCRRLVGLWVAQNVLLMGSAAWRLGLYVEAYGLTRWRVAAGVWMGLVAVGFVLLVWRIAADRASAWLVRRSAVAAAAVLYAVCFVDVDGAIARFNVTHCAELGGRGQPIDLVYLERLGPAALPAATRLVEGWPEGSSAKRAEATAVQNRLDRELGRDLADWRGWTVRRSRWAGQKKHDPAEAAGPHSIRGKLWPKQ
ncbi:MAG: DUF4173 domain-containing protein [Planctomycetota bacterium]